MIPFNLKTGDFVEPSEPLYYLFAGNGIFLVKKTPLFTAVTETRDVAGLDIATPALSLTIPKLPRDLMEKVYGFFDVVHRRWDGEAVAFLYYSPVRQQFHVDVPPQTLVRHKSHRGWRTEGRVEYGSLPRPDDFLWLGDVHSHGDLRAFFSDTDDRDDGQDGLRIVMGRLDRNPEVRVSFVTGGTRFDLVTEDVIEDFAKPVAPPPGWLRRINIQCKGVNGLTSITGWNEDERHS